MWTPSKGNKIILRELDSVTIFYDRNPFIFRDIVANEEKVSNEAKYFKKRYPIKQNILNCCNPEAVVSDAKYIIYCKLSLTANQLILIIERCICMIFEYEISAIICFVQLL